MPVQAVEVNTGGLVMRRVLKELRNPVVVTETAGNVVVSLYIDENSNPYTVERLFSVLITKLRDASLMNIKKMDQIETLFLMEDVIRFGDNDDLITMTSLAEEASERMTAQKEKNERRRVREMQSQARQAAPPSYISPPAQPAPQKVTVTKTKQRHGEPYTARIRENAEFTVRRDGSLVKRSLVGELVVNSFEPCTIQFKCNARVPVATQNGSTLEDDTLFCELSNARRYSLLRWSGESEPPYRVSLQTLTSLSYVEVTLEVERFGSAENGVFKLPIADSFEVESFDGTFEVVDNSLLWTIGACNEPMCIVFRCKTVIFPILLHYTFTDSLVQCENVERELTGIIKMVE